MSEMKDCPFCGCINPNVVFVDGKTAVSIECLKCSAQGGARSDEPAAVAAWNRRAKTPPPSLALIRLLTLCEQVLEACSTVGPHSSAMALADDIEAMVRRGVDEARGEG